jgi:hypothetical protein
MSKFISTVLFATLVGKAVAEDVYTNLWYPGIQDSGVTFVGSVVTAASDRTVMVVDYTNLASDMSDIVSDITRLVIAAEFNVNLRPRVLRLSLCKAELTWSSKPNS